MKRFVLAVLAMGLLVLTATPAFAHHADIDAFFDDGPYDAATWNQNVSEEICITREFRDSGIAPNIIDNIELAVVLGFREWKTQTDITKSIDFGNDGVAECAQNFSFRIGYENAEAGHAFAEGIREDYCQHRGNQPSSIEYEDLSWLGDPNRIGLTWTCDTDNNNLIDFVVIIIDPRAYHWNPEATTGPNEYDFPSIITHEGGHGYGFAKHWANDSETCPDTTAGHNTMCNDGWGIFEGLGGTAGRTIESHDIGEVNQNY
jgi:hypothetical protein